VARSNVNGPDHCTLGTKLKIKMPVGWPIRTLRFYKWGDSKYTGKVPILHWLLCRYHQEYRDKWANSHCRLCKCKTDKRKLQIPKRGYKGLKLPDQQLGRAKREKLLRVREATEDLLEAGSFELSAERWLWWSRVFTNWARSQYPDIWSNMILDVFVKFYLFKWGSI
jgi:hypothetical protein